MDVDTGGLSDKFLAPVAEHVVCAAVGLDDRAIELRDDERIAGRLEDTAILLLTLAERLRSTLALGDLFAERVVALRDLQRHPVKGVG